MFADPHLPTAMIDVSTTSERVERRQPGRRRTRVAGSQAHERDRAIRQAIVEAVAYSDVFDWPLTPAEVHRYLPVRAEPGEVEAALRSPRLSNVVGLSQGHVTLVGREALVPERRRREAVSAAMWSRAVRFARATAELPFVRFVAVTGSLALRAARDEADVDLLVVTEDGRLWLTRAMTIGVVRLAAVRGVHLCPNYFLTESALELAERDRFTAHELVQMVPLAGLRTHRALLERNAWYREFLPNHPGPCAPPWPLDRGRVRRLGERTLRAGPIDRLERWEMDRKIARLSVGTGTSEIRFDAAACKGHAGEHRRRTLAAFDQRLARIGEVTT